ncbi:hypothetical protein DERP_012984, partial [Dermatophagoides pteronyssinus]
HIINDTKRKKFDFPIKFRVFHNSENGENCLSCSINIDLRSFKRKLIYVDRFSNGEVLMSLGQI